MQESYDLPVGVLTESSIEAGHKVIKMARKRFSRNMSYSKEHRDILRRGLWTSDPILHYESTVLQSFKPGNIRKSRKKKEEMLTVAKNYVFEKLVEDILDMVNEVALEVIEEQETEMQEEEEERPPEVEDEFWTT